MPERPAPLRVEGAVEPYLLRSALYRLLADDARFEATLCPRGVDPSDHARATRASIVVVSGPVDLPGTCVVTLCPARAVLFGCAEQDDTLEFDGLAELLDQLAETRQDPDAA